MQTVSSVLGGDGKRDVPGILTLFLALFAALPFREMLAGWVPLAYLALFVAILGLAIYTVARRDRKIGIPIPAALFGIWILAATLYAPVWDRSFGLLGCWLTALLVGLVTHELSRRDPSLRLKLCLTLWVCASFVAVLNVGLLSDPEQLAESIRELPRDENYKQALLHAATQQRFNFPFGNPIHLGLFLTLSLLAVPALIRLARTEPRPLLMNAALILTAGVQAYVLWGTKSRTSILALGAGILTWIILLTGRTRRLLYGALTLCALVGILFAVFPSGREMLSRVETVRARAIYWETALRMVRDRPLFGAGIGGYGDHYPRYRGFTTHQTKFPHNVFLEVLTDTGAIGFLLLLFLLGYIVRRRFWIRNGASDEFTVESALAIWRIAALVAFLAATQLGFPHNMLYLVGVVAAIAAVAGMGPSAERGGDDRPGPLLSLKPIYFAGFLLVLSVPILLRETAYAQFEQGRKAFIENRDFVKARRELRTALRFWPPLAQAEHFCASALRDFGQPRLAEVRFRKAIRWDPTSAYVREDLADLLWKRGQREEALATLDEAIHLHWVKWNYHHLKSLWLNEMGDREGADREKRWTEYLKQYEPDYRKARLDQGRPGPPS